MAFSRKSPSKLWYTVQPKDGETSWDLLTPASSVDYLSRSNTKQGAMNAKDIKDILCKRIAFLSGGKDKRGRHILTIPNVREPYPHTEYGISTTLKYLSCILSKPRHFTVLLDVRSSTWNSAKPIIRILQYCLRDQIGMVCIVKPGEFWERHKASFNFKKYKDKLGFETVLVSVEKLQRYVDPTQLTNEFGGALYYDHQQWVRNRVSYEKYVSEAEEKLEFIQNMSDIAKRHDEEKSTDDGSSAEYSDSGNATGHTPTSSSSDTPVRSRRRNRAEHQTFPKPLPRSNSRGNEYVYHLPKQDSLLPPSNHSRSPVPAPRNSLSQTSKTPNLPVPPPRIRSRSLPPDRAREEKQQSHKNSGRRRTTKHERGPAPYNHVYSVPNYEPSTGSIQSNKHVSRSHSDRNLHEGARRSPQGGQPVCRNGPRYLRRRRERDDYETMTSSSERSQSSQRLTPSRSVPDLAKSNSQQPDQSIGAKRQLRSALAHFPNPTLLQGEKLLKQLQSSPDECGFYVGRSQAISDEGFLMMENVNKLQTILQKLEETSPEQLESKKQRRISRRKTVTGVPEVDGLNHDVQDHLTPNKIQEKLKIVYDWIRGPGEKWLDSDNALGDSLNEVNMLIRTHSQLLSKCVEPFRILSEIKQAFQRLTKPNRLVKKDSFKAVPQWVVSIEKNMKVVEDLSRQFQARLRQRGEVLQISLTFYKSADQLGSTLDKLMKICKKEASLMDCLDAIQNQLDELHYQNANMTNIQRIVVKAASSFLQRIYNHAQDITQDQKNGELHTSRVRQIVAKLNVRIQRCKEQTESCKVRLQHVLQLKIAQRDAQKAIEWLCQAKHTIQQVHRALGKSAKEVEYLMEQHESIKLTGKQSYDDGNKQLSAISVLRRCLELSPPHGAPKSPALRRAQSSGQLVSTSGKLLPSLEDAWDAFVRAWHERRSRLSVARLFHNNSEQLFKRGSQLEVDIDHAFPYSTGYVMAHKSQPRNAFAREQIAPLRAAHYSFHDDLDDVMKLGDNLLREAASYETLQSDVGSAIQVKLNQLSDLKTSVQSKWTKLKDHHEIEKSDSSHKSSYTISSWVESVNESTDWIRLRLVECSPNAFEIGRNLKEALKLQKQHEDLLAKVKEKDEVVITLLEKEQRENRLGGSSPTTQSSATMCSYTTEPGLSQERKMHKAMSHSLSDLWKDLNALLARRLVLLDTSVNFYSACTEFGNQLTCLEQYLHWEELPLDKSTAVSLLRTLEEMHGQMLEASTACLGRGRELMDMMKTLKSNHPDRHKASFGSACTAIECTLESLVERRRQVQYRYETRQKQLEHTLKIREWEDEVDQVATWFEVTRLTKLEDVQLGVDESNTEALLCHLDQVKEQAQRRLERAKKLVERANAELKAFGSDPVTMQSRDLDDVGESFMRRIDKRKDELTSVVKYYRLVNECEVSLDALGKKLEQRKFSSEPEEAQEQKANFLGCVRAASDPALDSAIDIMQSRSGNEIGAEGVIRVRESLKKHRDVLLNIIERYSNDAFRINEMMTLFTKTCEEIQDWTTTVAGGMLSTNGVIGNNQQMASQFLVWHRLLLQDIQRKSSELESLVQTANVLLEAGVANPGLVRQQAESTKSNWTELNKRVNIRISLAETFTKFLATVDKLYDEIEKLQETVSRDRKSKACELTRSYLNELGDRIRSVQTQCMDIMEESTCLNAKLKEGVPGDTLEASSTIEAVSEQVANLHKKKGELTDAWLSWRYKAGVNKETSVQQKMVERTINRIMASLENLEQSIFIDERILLGKDLDSNQSFVDQMKDRQLLLESIHNEIEKTVKHAEIVGLRIPSSSGKDSTDPEEEAEFPIRNMIKALLTRYQMLNTRMRNYKQALEVARNCYGNISSLWKALEESERDFSERVYLTSTTSTSPTPKKQSFLNVMLRGHDRIKEQVDEIMNTVTSESFEVHRIINRFRHRNLGGTEDKQEVDFDESVTEVTDEYARWRKLWQEYRDNLLCQQGSSWFFNAYPKHRDGLLLFDDRLQTLEMKLSKCRDKNRAYLLQDEATKLVGDVMLAKQAWEMFVSTTSDRLKGENPQISTVHDVIEKTDSDMKLASQRSQKAVKSADILHRFYTLTEECESWNEELKQMISAIRQKSSSIESSEEAKDLVEMFNKNLMGRFEEQSARAQQFASIVVEAEEDFDDDVHSDKSPVEEENLADLPFRNLLKSKQHDITESVNTLRDEVDVLHDLIESVRTKADIPPPITVQSYEGEDASSNWNPTQTLQVVPYDMSLLLDENLEKEKLLEKMKKELFENPSENRQTTPNEVHKALEPIQKDVDHLQLPDHSDQITSTSVSSVSDEYVLDQDSLASVSVLEEPVLTARRASSPDNDESDFSDFMKDFVRIDRSSASSSFSSPINDSSFSSSASTNSKGRLAPPKPPRNAKRGKRGRRKYWERELDMYQPTLPGISGKHRQESGSTTSGSENLIRSPDPRGKVYHRFT